LRIHTKLIDLVLNSFLGKRKQTSENDLWEILFISENCCLKAQGSLMTEIQSNSKIANTYDDWLLIIQDSFKSQIIFSKEPFLIFISVESLFIIRRHLQSVKMKRKGGFLDW